MKCVFILVFPINFCFFILVYSAFDFVSSFHYVASLDSCSFVYLK